jgi:hypothetical protein
VGASRSIAEFLLPVVGVIPQLPVELRGEWSSSIRRTYESPAQSGTGAGPFVEVEDVRWHGTLECSAPLAGIAFLVTSGRVDWVRSPPATVAPTLELSLHRYAGHVDAGASFAASLHGARLHTVPVPGTPNLRESCTPRAGSLLTGSGHLVAEAGGVEFWVVLVPGSVIKVGRNRIWHLRDELAAVLPVDVRQVLARRRTGGWAIQPA